MQAFQDSLRRTSRAKPQRRGGVMVEFALVAFVLYLLLAAVLGLGRLTFVSQGAQEAVRVAAREIALYPLPAQTQFAEALADPGFQGAVYSEDHLVVDLEANPPGPALEARFAAMPVANRALRPLMVTSQVDVGGGLRLIQHLPGALIDSATAPSGLTVRVPLVTARDAETGVETIDLVPVLEEVGPGSFSTDSADGGLVAIRLNVPYQSATLSAYLPGPVNEQGNPTNLPVLADDASVDAPADAYVTSVGPGPDGTGPYSGTYGLGEANALGQQVRPFRRVVAAQALFRREVFRAP